MVIVDIFGAHTRIPSHSGQPEDRAVRVQAPPAALASLHFGRFVGRAEGSVCAQRIYCPKHKSSLGISLYQFVLHRENSSHNK